MADDGYKIQIESDKNLNSQSNLVTNENSMAQFPVNNDNEKENNKILKYD